MVSVFLHFPVGLQSPCLANQEESSAPSICSPLPIGSKSDLSNFWDWNMTWHVPSPTSSLPVFGGIRPEKIRIPFPPTKWVQRSKGLEEKAAGVCSRSHFQAKGVQTTMRTPISWVTKQLFLFLSPWICVCFLAGSKLSGRQKNIVSHHPQTLGVVSVLYLNVSLG